MLAVRHRPHTPCLDARLAQSINRSSHKVASSRQVGEDGVLTTALLVLIFVWLATDSRRQAFADR
ncbi:hypothetical protein BJD12_07775 [Xanthomonas vesicatoria ATCC 35937]|uniref:Uncharacterized protein n=1 Tax=Xanthomonas vesicatoria TaxID=56460 RepID=A0AAJ0N3J7_9XANT|nr:hypothetical protein BI313_10520 [Xanthomonas vesicatoria]APP75175.1 hypothetical protein BJD12_07775 [Xanthomonas vesicatoria ATCC 35937]KHM93570.1 hypothetical protein OR61_13805 [Xanthomonas vesicatoria]KHM96323.1 hypothetical protein OR60_05895 [Xanthomonas vesicatoria]KTF32746.1 hypothetical protein LMG920_12045 [Xanthomonas vesicatoria]